MAVTGQCRCGGCRVELAIADLPLVYACHCHLCQRWSGSAFSLQALVPEAVVQTSGPVAVYEHRTDGRTSVQRVCTGSHARLYNTNTRRPGIAVVRAGTLDRSEELACRAHIFTNYRQRWLTIDPAMPQWSDAPEPAAFIAVMTAKA